MFEIFVIWIFCKIGFWTEGKASKKCILCIPLKASISELWHNILLRCSDTIAIPFYLEYALALCIDIVSYMSTLWSCFVVNNGYTNDLDHPLELLMHTGRKPGKSWSWVDTSLSLVPRRDEHARYGMARLEEWWFISLVVILLEDTWTT